ncbi:hypothetical protein ONZ45_g15149 [Pleurotus djamor]|nr:hypothetical protein ONZ45_g15149 [Pleurotus djamor]
MTSACAPSPLALKLPPELLAGVFSHVTPHFETTDPACLVQWIRTTHVCHYWRDVALKYARLWTTFFLGPYCESTDPSLFDLCFQRSGSLPVALLCVVGDFGWVEDMLMSFALNDATQDKVKHLKIVGSKSHLLSLLSLMSYFPLSTLEFTINRTSKSDDHALWLPHPLLNQFIGLTSLSTTRCAFELDSVLYSPHLTTLELRNLPPSQRLPISDLMSLSKRLPNITTLTLIESLQLPRSSSDLTTPQVLRNLRSFHIVDIALTCFVFMACLVAPNLESLNVGYESGPEARDTVQDVLLYANAAIRSPLPYTELRLQTSGLLQGRLHLGTVAGDVLTIKTTISTQRSSHTKMGLAVYTNLSVGASLYFLELESSPDTYKSEIDMDITRCKDDWKSMFSKFSSLRVLRLKTYRPLLLIETLFERAMLCIGCARDSTSQHHNCYGTGTQLLSHLETIEFVNFSFYPTWNLENNHTGVAEYPLEDLLIALLWAIKRHSPSKYPTISFTDCVAVDRHWIAELRRYTSVECDDRLNLMVSNSFETMWLPPEETFDGLVTWYKLFEKPDEDSDMDI